jgi:cation transport ATPase
VDPLRAGHVAILDSRFVYYCDASCKVLHWSAVRSRQSSDELRAPVSTLSPDEVATAEPPPVLVIESGPRRTTNGSNGTNGSHEVHEDALALVAQHETSPPPAPEQPEQVEESVAVVLPFPSSPQAIPEAREAPETKRSPAVRIEPTAEAPPTPDDAAPASERRDVGTTRENVRRAVSIAGVAAGALCASLGLVGEAGDVLRLPLALFAAGAFLARVVLGKRDPADVHPLATLVPVVIAAAAACWARLVDDPYAVPAAVLAAAGAAAILAVDMLLARARVQVASSRARIARALDVRVRVVHGDVPTWVDAADVKPGEQVVVEPGEVVGVDAVVSAGEAIIVPWLDAPVDMPKRDGDAVVAGARVVSGRLRLVTTWHGLDRAWTKLTLSPALRADVVAPAARGTRMAVERGTPLVAALVGVAAFANNASPVGVVAAACAAGLAVGASAVASVVALHHARGVLAALGAGIAYKDARAFDQAGDVDVAMLCARGTVLMGEPEIVTIEAVGANDVLHVLSLAAGAEASQTHPFATAILRAARARGVRPDNVRNASTHAGLGVTALSSTGERLAVGSRGLMLKERISVALADARINELEAQGRSVLLVAIADKLVGMLALQDGLRAGARGAVQRLLDAKLEPVLLSGEARETCETIGRALDIDHVRPEILPSDRGAEVKALGEGAHTVAVIGHPATDDGALGAADVAVAMRSAGSTPGEWAVSLASDDVRDAAAALAIPHATRERVRVAIALGVAPSVVAAILVAFGIAPLAVAPLAGLVGAIAALVHAKDGT